MDEQIKLILDSSNHLIIHQPSPVPHAVIGVVQGEVVEGLSGKVKGLEQCIQTEGYAFEGLREIVVGLWKK